MMTQMLLRASNGVGYTNYPDNVVQSFVAQAADSGVDVFRVFDSLNWVENMRVAMDAVLEAGKVCEGTICYTGDISTRTGPSTTSSTTSPWARSWRQAGAHVLGLKDMAGLLKPAAAGSLIRALKEEVGLPIHFHTHDTSGAAIATVLAAADAGVDAVDCRDGRAVGQHLASRRSARSSRRCAGPSATPGSTSRAIREISNYWEEVRAHYAAFESGHAGARLRGLPARDARRPVHQPQGAGAVDGARGALARGRPDLCRREPDVRRHREGHAVVQGRGRHGADDGQPGPDPRRGRGPQGRRLLPRQRRST